MAIPDVQDLYERYLRMLGTPNNSVEPSPSKARTQSPPFGYTMPSEASPTHGGYPSGGVLGARGSPSQHSPWPVQALSSPTRVAIGPRGPWPVGRIGPGVGVPVGPPPDRIAEIPNPHLERFIPQSTRDIWTAATLLPWILRRKLLGDERSDGATEGQDGAALPERSPEPPPNRPGNQAPWLLGPAILEKEYERQGRTSNQDPRPREVIDPNFRGLTKFLGSEGDQIVSEKSFEPAGEENPHKQPAIPLSDLDIPDFLRRRPETEAPKSEQKGTDLPASHFGGGGNYGGNRGGGGGGGRKSDEECRREWRRAQQVCAEAFANGTIGEIYKQWKSNYATGPFPTTNGKPWDVNDCKRGFVSKDCGGNDYETPPPPKVAQAIGRNIVRQKKDARDKRRAKERAIYEEFKRTGKWRFRG